MDREEYLQVLNGLNTEFDNLVEDHETALNLVKNALFEAIDELGVKAQGVAFSGGIDSCFLLLHARQINHDIKAITVGTMNSPDMVAAKEFVDKFTFSHINKELSEEEVQLLIREVCGIIPKKDVVSVGVGAVTLQVCKLAKEAGMSTILAGLGSEEVFAGYQRHAEAFEEGGFKALHEECWKGLLGLYDRDLSRDLPLAKSQEITILAPYLHPKVIKAAMSIHPKFKVNKDFKKVILREIAERNGVEEKWAWRKKKAAQYGSSFHKVLEKMAKSEGKKISEFLKQYEQP